MPLPIVAIVAEDSRLPAEARSAIVASCARVSGQGRCVAGSDPYAPAARYLAVVTVAADGKLRVDLRLRRDSASRGARDLVFPDTKLGDEHWNSAGLVIAALVADADANADADAPPSQEKALAAPILKAEPSRTRTRSDVWLRVAVCGVAAPGFDFDPWRLGAEVRLAAGSRRFLLYPLLAARWTFASGRAHTRATSEAFGLGLRLIDQDDSVDLNLEVVGMSDTLLISATTREGTQESFRTRYGARLGLSSNVQLMSRLRAFLGAEVSWLGERAVLEIDGERLGAEPRYVPGFALGLSLGF
jgi:hypothetical protein